MTRKAPDRKGKSPTAVAAANRPWLTVPNALCAVRSVGSLALFPLALAERPLTLLVVFLVLAATDWLDGKLAVWLDQQSPLGARLDSLADAVMYGGLLFGVVCLQGEVLGAEWPWIVAALVAYAASCAAALIKYGRFPSYHAWSAKIAWMLTVTATVLLFWGQAAWPLRVALLAVTVANLEALLITLILPEWRANVRSFADVLDSKESRPSADQDPL